jgi:T4-like virus tail tube protein gp19
MADPTTVNTNNLLKMTAAKITATALFFHKFDPPSLSLDNVTHNTWDATGKLQANNGGAVNPLHGEWGLERVLDTNGDLWTWFSNTNQQGPAAQQDNITITILANDGTTPLATWTLNNTTPISYSQAGQDANSNAVMTESIRFYSTDIQYKSGG